jgi:16S rRNA (adenine1518-N6/adenine1519-N6)-dimethyltransferase
VPKPHRSPAQVPGESQQHDLTPTAAGTIVAAARVGEGDRVLEIGGGLGELTAALLATGAQVQTIERDAGRVEHLNKRFNHQIAKGRLVVIPGDALRLLPSLGGPWRVVANPPFNITSSLIRRFLLDEWPDGPPRALDLLLQKEAVHKLGGAQRNETRSSVLVRLLGDPRLGLELRRNDVAPPSRVDLALWSWKRRAETPERAELMALDRLLEKAFAGTHTMREALRGTATPTQLKRQAAERGWEIDAHPRTLRASDWLSLSRIVNR